VLIGSGGGGGSGGGEGDWQEPLLAIRGELAQLNGNIEKLQCTGIDAVVTAELTSGKTEAKEQRKGLTKRADTLQKKALELKKRLEQRINLGGSGKSLAPPSSSSRGTSDAQAKKADAPAVNFAKKDTGEKAKQEAEEQAKRAAEGKAKHEAGKQVKQEAEKQAKQEAEKQARQEATQETEAKKEAVEKANNSEDDAAAAKEKEELAKAKREAKKEAEEAANKQAKRAAADQKRERDAVFFASKKKVQEEADAAKRAKMDPAQLAELEAQKAHEAEKSMMLEKQMKAYRTAGKGGAKRNSKFLAGGRGRGRGRGGSDAAKRKQQMNILME
jgi:hypothetical protein